MSAKDEVQALIREQEDIHGKSSAGYRLMIELSERLDKVEKAHEPYKKMEIKNV